tara:strand:- start:718 stop:1104 length:387 start_codon:yes stop_codon:yes gene_type:complete
MSTLRKKHNIWTDNAKTQLEYYIHPGLLLAKYMQWAGAVKGCASMYGPEPDVVNIAFLSNKPLPLPIDHVYYVRPDPTKDEWISFGHSDDPKTIARQVQKEYHCAYWINKAAKKPRKILEKIIWDYEM